MNYVLQINSWVPLTRENFPQEDLYDYIHELLDPENEYDTDERRKSIAVPVSIICYSRKAVGESVDKLLCIDQFCEDRSPFEASKVKRSDSRATYDISLLRKCLKVALKDHQSSRNAMATYETDSHINHEVQKTIIENYEKRISKLSALYFGNDVPGYSKETFQSNDPHYGKNVDESYTFDNANAHYIRECLNSKQRNIYADRKDDYDTFSEKVLQLENDTEPCDRSYLEELRRIVNRWYYRKDHNMERQLAIWQQRDRTTYPPRNMKAPNSHNYYPLPDLGPKTVKDLKKTVRSMKPYFYNFSIFITLLDGEEEYTKGAFGKMIEESFDWHNHPLFKNFCLDEWYRSICEDDSGVAHERNIEDKFDCLLIDPTETYQGPKLLLPAGWNKMVSHVCLIPFFLLHK